MLRSKSKPRALFNLIHTSSKLKGEHDFPTALPMISRGFWFFWVPESRYKGERDLWRSTAVFRLKHPMLRLLFLFGFMSKIKKSNTNFALV